MKKVFMSISAAPGNIGDIYIRRQVIDAFNREGTGGVLYAGSMPVEYREAFHLSPRWRITSSYRVFLLQLVCSYASRQCVFVMAPGPAQLGGRLGPTLKHILVTFLIVFGRVTGNRVLVLGRAVRSCSKVGVVFERIIARSSNIYLVRDLASLNLLDREKVQYAPDFAFGSQSTVSDQARTRTYASISLRHDRMVNTDTFKDLVDLIKSLGLLPRMVVQVKEDQSSSLALAALAGIDILSWNRNVPHSVQENLVLSAYRESSIVISDRLHALIFGANSGAIPIIVERSGEDKLHVTLDPVIEPQSVWLNGMCPIGGIDCSGRERDRIRSATSRAAEQLNKIWKDVITQSGI
ncbi:polysaccharide pyruvyl transferase family protein [Rhodococcus fascians]|nr:polysaccharide pyruvyl transferase family protein [Rhodococcus fascians]MBY4235565.1 polysaccharide pyruvyl transferase family protein [Rhodococcus fascians]MBY4251256.1 polysaccharide pyruvyl transferase family protein [Rhodococcus fascians]MBY4266911.1 polysaccharide pyruvyl transferase family protein [Rhodococcus fascians]